MQNLTFAAVLVCLSLVACRSVDPREVHARGQKSGICPAHHVTMVMTAVPLFYGYYVSESDGPSPEFRASHFPFAQWFVMGGGPVIEGKSKNTEELYHCAECERAKLAWISRHPESKWGKEEYGLYPRRSR